MKYSIEKTLDLHKQATARTRKIFLILNICSILLLISLFNYKWSWRLYESEHSDINTFTYEFHERHLDKAGSVATWLKDKNGYVQEKEKLNYVVSTLNDYHQNKHDSLPFSTKYLKVTSRKPAQPDSDMLFIDLPFIGIKIYVQDVPFLGGFAIAILLTWYFYARRREKGFVKKLFDALCKEKTGNAKDKIYNEVVDNSIFNTILEIDDDVKIKFKKVSDAFVSFLMICPVILIGIYQIYDISENLFYGAESQKYLKIGNETLIGSEVDFYRINFNIPVSEPELVPNVPTLQFTDMLFSRDPDKKKEIKWHLSIIMFLSIILLIYSVVQTFNIMMIRKEDGNLIKKIFEFKPEK